MSPAPYGQERRGLPLRAVIPNAVTALALCIGLTGVRFAIDGDWERAVAAVIVAAVLDGMDGRIARMIRGQTRFGAELDSLSDSIAFGVAPAVIVYLWSLQSLPKFGWLFALAHAVCCALRLARFNAAIDRGEQPHKRAGYLTGVPAPAGAGLLLLPLYLWQWTGEPVFREVLIVAPWTALVAFLMISNIATLSWTFLRLRSHVRLWVLVVVALAGGALLSAPWPSLATLAILYAALIPYGVYSYRRAQARRSRTPDPAEMPRSA
ncbi:MAG: CDP-alcohol phosphatidyltransferase family protein [Sphingomonadaceae bacterium]